MLSLVVKYANSISAIATSFGLISLFLVYKQLKETKIWNKLHFTYTFFPNPMELEVIEMFLDERIQFWKRDSQLTQTEVKALIGKDPLQENEKDILVRSFGQNVDKNNVANELYEAGRKLKLYMNQIESYCAAIQSGIVDSDTAKRVYCYKFQRAYLKAYPWINEIRTIKNEKGLYIELTNVLNEWDPPTRGQKKKYV